MKYATRRWFTVLLAAVLCLALVGSSLAETAVYLPLVGRRFLARPVIWGTVTHVCDGDTFDVELARCPVLDRVRVRPIGIDTPERGQCFYGEATAALEALVLGGRVALELDVDHWDSYNHLLVDVFLPDGTWVNGLLVRRGSPG